MCCLLCPIRLSLCLRAVILTGIYIIIGTVPSPAHAHMGTNIGDFYGGMLHPVLGWETLLPILALGLWLVQLGIKKAGRLLFIFVGAVLLGALGGLTGVDLAAGPVLVRISLFALGLLVVMGYRLPIPVTIAMLVIFGLGNGYANTFESIEGIQKPHLYILGLTGGIGMLLIYIVGFMDFLERKGFRIQTATRVLGGLIVVTGLLLSISGWILPE